MKNYLWRFSASSMARQERYNLCLHIEEITKQIHSIQDLIRIIVNQQNAVDFQGKKITDLESYIDNLLSKVIEVAPVVLQKDIRNANRWNC